MTGNRVAFIAAIGLCASCGQPQTQSSNSATGPSPASAPAIEDWQMWEELSSERFFSEGHSEMYVEVYVPPEQVDAYLDEQAEIPADMTVVKPQYASEEAEAPENLTVMVRDEATESGWTWGMYSPDGTEAMEAGQMDMCIDCHSGAGEDMLFRELSGT